MVDSVDTAEEKESDCMDVEGDDMLDDSDDVVEEYIVSCCGKTWEDAGGKGVECEVCFEQTCWGCFIASNPRVRWGKVNNDHFHYICGDCSDPV